MEENKQEFYGTMKRGQVSCRDAIGSLMRNLPDNMSLKITIEEYKKPRSAQQNKYYWGVVIAFALGFYRNNIRAFIEDVLKAVKFRITDKFTHEMFKMLFNDGKSTAKLDTAGMTEYWDKIRHHFLHEHKVDIAPPNEEQMEGYNDKQ